MTVFASACLSYGARPTAQFGSKQVRALAIALETGRQPKNARDLGSERLRLRTRVSVVEVTRKSFESYIATTHGWVK